MDKPLPESEATLDAETKKQGDTELRAIWLDLLQSALDVAGIVDPTPVSGGVGTLVALARAEWIEALLNGTSMIPVIGRLAKIGKLSKAVLVFERAAELARRSPQAARELTPVFARLDQVLRLFPDNVGGDLRRLRSTVESVLRKEGVHHVPTRLPDISRHFSFRQFKAPDGSLVREGSGRLGVPGKVKTHPKSASSSTGDDFGHLIGERFGPHSKPENYGAQNWQQNQYGTFKKLENRWAEQIKEGTDIQVTVREYTRPGDTRPWKREVQWTETSPQGSESQHELTFLNTHSAKSRDRQGIAPTVPPDHPGATIHTLPPRQN